jgi:hypothetical protein
MYRKKAMDRCGDGVGTDRKALWVIRQVGLPAVVRPCGECRQTRHQPAGSFRVNANGKLLDVWMLLRCERCGRSSKIAVHERIHVRALGRERLVRFEQNDRALVRELAMDAALARSAGYRLDWAGTWELETDLPFYELEGADQAPLEVIVSFELPVPIRVERLLMAGFGLSRAAARALVGSGRIRLPMAMTARAAADFTFLVGARS